MCGIVGHVGATTGLIGRRQTGWVAYHVDL
jgi:hypothetical protein